MLALLCHYCTLSCYPSVNTPDYRLLVLSRNWFLNSDILTISLVSDLHNGFHGVVSKGPGSITGWVNVEKQTLSLSRVWTFVVPLLFPIYLTQALYFGIRATYIMLSNVYILLLYFKMVQITYILYVFFNIEVGGDHSHHSLVKKRKLSFRNNKSCTTTSVALWFALALDEEVPSSILGRTRGLQHICSPHRITVLLPKKSLHFSVYLV